MVNTLLGPRKQKDTYMNGRKTGWWAETDTRKPHYWTLWMSHFWFVGPLGGGLDVEGRGLTL
eukprot:1396-Eustigmatos_ZCMA.PRE.1